MADKLKNHLNESFNPCEDFWNYACGGFLSRTEIPEGKKSYGLDDEVNDINDSSIIHANKIL